MLLQVYLTKTPGLQDEKSLRHQIRYLQSASQAPSNKVNLNHMMLGFQMHPQHLSAHRRVHPQPSHAHSGVPRPAAAAAAAPGNSEVQIPKAHTTPNESHYRGQAGWAQQAVVKTVFQVILTPTQAENHYYGQLYPGSDSCTGSHSLFCISFQVTFTRRAHTPSLVHASSLIFTMTLQNR